MPDDSQIYELLFDVATPLGFSVRVTRSHWRISREAAPQPPRFDTEFAKRRAEGAEKGFRRPEVALALHRPPCPVHENRGGPAYVLYWQLNGPSGSVRKPSRQPGQSFVGCGLKTTRTLSIEQVIIALSIQQTNKMAGSTRSCLAARGSPRPRPFHLTRRGRWR